MLSDRTSWSLPANRLWRLREEMRLQGRELIDLTETNPTRAGLEYPADELSAILAAASRATYDAQPRGLAVAREALAAALSRPGDSVSPDDLVLTASTSEAYAYLFKLLANPGDEVLSATPGYPLLEHLAALESIRLTQYPMHYLAAGERSRWAIEMSELRDRLSERTRAIVLVHPNNPTGSFVRSHEQTAVAALCRERSLALISDEVFIEYPFADDPLRAGPAAEHDECLSFSLGGLSKSAGLPHWKLGWIRVGGPWQVREEVLSALELIADTFLSVATPVQVALPSILTIAPRIQATIRERLRANLQVLRALVQDTPLEPLPVEGGWSAVLRYPRLASDEETVMALLQETGVIVHPGFFFDFDAEGYLVVSLLTGEAIFREGMTRLARWFARRR